jgi:hypothetical protein
VAAGDRRIGACDVCIVGSDGDGSALDQVAVEIGKPAVEEEDWERRVIHVGGP